MVTLFCSQKDRFRADCFMLFQVVPRVVTPLQTLKQQTMFCSQDKWLVVKKRPRGCEGKTPAQTVCKTNWLVVNSRFWIMIILNILASRIPKISSSTNHHLSVISVIFTFLSPYLMVKKKQKNYYVTTIINQLGY